MHAYTVLLDQVSLEKVTTIKSEARRYELFMKKKRVRGDKATELRSGRRR